MSNSYSLEPPTHGKVLLTTTYGDLDIELWPNQAPLACRNFCQLVMEGYYNNTAFHRVIRNFLFQGGDPSGTGQLNPSDTIYGTLFKDEFHSRLKFNHRGLVGCANDNRADSNGSMFFITLDRADHLNKKATIFGRVCGDTLHNLSRFNEVDTDEDDRPEFPIYITEAKVLIPPFEDLAPRKQAEDGAKIDMKAKVVKGKVKNAALMSFDDEDFEDEGFAVKKVEVRPKAAAVKSVENEETKDLKNIKAEKEAKKRHDEVLLDYGDGEEDGMVRETDVGPPTSSAAALIHNESKRTTQKTVREERGVSLVQAAREKYVSQQKKYSSKRKKESDVLARIKQFKSSSLQQKAEEISEKEDTRRDGRSILRQLDDLLQG